MLIETELLLISDSTACWSVQNASAWAAALMLVDVHSFAQLGSF
jgi:hypothetical protein